MSHRTAWAVSTAIGERTEGPLLITGNDTQLDRRGAARIVARVARHAGITKRITPHSRRLTPCRAVPSRAECDSVEVLTLVSREQRPVEGDDVSERVGCEALG